MILSGLHPLIAFRLIKFIRFKKPIYPAIFVGSLIPDLDIIFSTIASIFISSESSVRLFSQTFSHSVFSAFFIYLFLMVIFEISNKNQKNVVKSLITGILIHILIDFFLEKDGIQFLWPLPLDKINLWGSLSLSDKHNQILLSFEFLWFRIYAWYLINFYIKNPTKNGFYLRFIYKWMKIEFILFIFFLIFANLNSSNFIFIFNLMYIPSLIISILSTTLMWDSIYSLKEDNL